MKKTLLTSDAQVLSLLYPLSVALAAKNFGKACQSRIVQVLVVLKLQLRRQRFNLLDSVAYTLGLLCCDASVAIPYRLNVVVLSSPIDKGYLGSKHELPWP